MSDWREKKGRLTAGTCRSMVCGLLLILVTHPPKYSSTLTHSFLYGVVRSSIYSFISDMSKKPRLRSIETRDVLGHLFIRPSICSSVSQSAHQAPSERVGEPVWPPGSLKGARRPAISYPKLGSSIQVLPSKSNNF